MESLVRQCLIASVLTVVGCGDDGDLASVPDAARPPPDETHFPAPDPRPRDWGSATGERGDCGLADPEAVAEEFGDCETRTLPGTGAEYCIKAHPDCRNAGADCPLYISLNINDAYMGRVDQPHRYGKLIVVRLNDFGDEPRDKLAELPRVIADDYDGLDSDRVYALGWSIGSAKLYEGLSRGAYDQSPYGTTSDVYAGIANLGGCLKNDGDPATEPNFHVIMVNGKDDPFGNNGCDLPEDNKDWAHRLAVKNRCSDPEVRWTNVGADDSLMAGGDGTDIAEKATFGACPGGDVVAYRFRDEEHELVFDRHFDPRVRALEIAWDFFQGRLRPGVDGGITGPGSACYE